MLMGLTRRSRGKWELKDRQQEKIQNNCYDEQSVAINTIRLSWEKKGLNIFK